MDLWSFLYWLFSVYLAVVNFFTNLYDRAKKLLEDLWARINAEGDTYWNILWTYLHAWYGTLFYFIDSWYSHAQWLADAVTGVWARTKQVFQDEWLKISKFMSALYQSLHRYWLEFETDIAILVVNWWTRVVQAFDYVNGKWGQLWTYLFPWYYTFYDAIKNWWSNARWLCYVVFLRAVGFLELSCTRLARLTVDWYPILSELTGNWWVVWSHFIDDPAYLLVYMLERLRLSLVRYRGDVSRLGESILRYIWEGQL